MGLTYATFSQQITILAEASIAPSYSLANVPDFANTLPNAISYAEGRIYRECTFLAARQSPTVLMTAGSRVADLSTLSPVMLVPEGFAIIYPFTQTVPKNGLRIPYDVSSLDLIDIFWPQESVTIDPSTVDYHWWAMKDDKTIVIAPTPDQNYTAEVTGLVQPTPLSATNTTTYLSNVYPDLLIAASMIFVSGFLRDFGAQTEDPKMAESWESQYGKLVTSTVEEEQRRRSAGTGWSANLPTPLAKPPRN